jgi:hypothetical protein
MTAAPTPSLPGPRTLLGWWRELASVRPRRLWFCPLLLHRLDALVSVAHSGRLGPLSLGLLRHLIAANGTPLDALRLDRSVLHRLLAELERDALVQRPGSVWTPTATGQSAAQEGTFVGQVPERRTFYFVDNTCCNRPNHFLHLNRPPGGPAPIVTNWHFDVTLLADSVRQSASWKAAHQFPSDVLAVYPMEQEPPGAPPAWRRVPIDQAEQAIVVLVLAPANGDGSALHGFTVRVENWSLFREAPLFSLTEGWQDVFPDAAAGPSADEWRQAWVQWCEPRGVPKADAEVCTLEPREETLKVRVPKAVMDRLRAAKGDPLKHEACLLAGTVRARAMAMLEFEMLE